MPPLEPAQNKPLKKSQRTERYETPGVWAQDFLVNLGRVRMAMFHMRRDFGQIRYVAPRYGEVPAFEPNDVELASRYCQVLLDERPFEVHVYGRGTLPEVLRRYPPRRCMVDDHPGAQKRLVMCRGQNILVWPVCYEHEEFLFDPARNQEWCELIEESKQWPDSHGLRGL